MASFSEAGGKDLVSGSWLPGTEGSASLNWEMGSPGAENSLSSRAAAMPEDCQLHRRGNGSFMKERPLGACGVHTVHS